MEGELPEKSNFDDVAACYRKFGLGYEGPPRELDDKTSAFRIKFLREELEEYERAVESGDVPGQFDALVDLVYVALGTALLHGFPWKEGWDEVQRANISKERSETSKRGTGPDLIKPPGWQAPNIEGVLARAADRLSRHEL